MHVILREASPHQLTRPRVHHIDNEGAHGSLVNRVPNSVVVPRGPAGVVRSPAPGIPQPPKWSPVAVHVVVGFDGPSRGHIHIRVLVDLSQSARLELRAYSRMSTFGDERTVTCGRARRAVVNRAVLERKCLHAGEARISGI